MQFSQNVLYFQSNEVAPVIRSSLSFQMLLVWEEVVVVVVVIWLEMPLIIHSV